MVAVGERERKDTQWSEDTMSSTPLVVTHPCALVRDALCHILTKSQFRPVRILPTLDRGAESYLGSAGICIWLLGVRECASTTNDLVRRVVAANPSVRPVILAESHTAQDIVFALASGACGFLSQNIPSKQLIKSLELVALGQTVIHPQFHQMAFAQMGVESHSTRGFEATSASSGNGGYNAIAKLPRHSEEQPPVGLLALPAAETPGTSNGGPAGDVVRDLSRRELVILRTLTEGASNKVIALKLVITESTVKVHMKAILRKLRLQNRTQAAIWARTHLGELLENATT
jgi:two-component system, NarL family, nitrate/nitrite response regulator NarL